MIDLSVIIPSYENADLLDECLDALGRARAAHPSPSFEVIVVDNGSGDDGVARARASALGVRVIALLRNRGFAAAVNLGLRARHGRHVLLLNSDAVVESDVLLRGVALLDAAGGEIGVVGASLRHPGGRVQRSIHAFPDWTSELLPDRLIRSGRRWRSSGRGERSGAVSAPPAALESPLEEVEAVRGAVFFIAGTTLDTVGELDEGYFFFLEETDYCWRVRAAGQRVVHAAGLHATHRLGASSKARAPLATRIEYQRSLDRFLALRRGRRVAALARTLRCLRWTAGLVPLALAAPIGPRPRGRFRERAGLLLWHLRGRPAEPALATALAVAVERSHRAGRKTVGREGRVESADWRA